MSTNLDTPNNTDPNTATNCTTTPIGCTEQQPCAAPPAPPPVAPPVVLPHVAPPSPPPPPIILAQKSSSWNGCWRGCVLSVVIFIGTIFLFCLLIGISVSHTKSYIVNTAINDKKSFLDGSTLSEMTVSGDDIEHKVLQLSLSGAIHFEKESSPWREMNGNTLILLSIRQATKDSTVSGIFLTIDSGGGEITASDVIWNELKKFKDSREDRFIVVLMESICASGAYYIASCADYIIAHPTTVTGSIGVIMSSYNIREMAEKIGLKSVTIKSGKNKNIMDPFVDMTPEQEKMLQNIVDSLHARFVNVVATGREIKESQVMAIADGRILLAKEALDCNLIDEIGYRQDALDRIVTMLDGNEPRYIKYSQYPGIFQLFGNPAFWGKCFSSAIEMSVENGAFVISPKFQ